MSFFNYKVELKLRWTKHCILFVLGVVNADNDGDDSNNIIFTIADIKLYAPVVTFSG